MSQMTAEQEMVAVVPPAAVDGAEGFHQEEIEEMTTRIGEWARKYFALSTNAGARKGVGIAGGGVATLSMRHRHDTIGGAWSTYWSRRSIEG